MKDKILSELPTVTSVRQRDRRKPSLLYCSAVCEEDMMRSSLMKNDTNEVEKTRLIYDTAKIVRDGIIKYAEGKEENKVMTVSSTNKDVPSELYSLIQWILVGSEEKLQTEVKNRTVDRSTLTVCQNNVCFQNQGTNTAQAKKSSDTFWLPHSRENPQVLGLALTVHHDTRNKMLMNLLHTTAYHTIVHCS